MLMFAGLRPGPEGLSRNTSGRSCREDRVSKSIRYGRAGANWGGEIDVLQRLLNEVVLTQPDGASTKLRTSVCRSVHFTCRTRSILRSAEKAIEVSRAPIGTGGAYDDQDNQAFRSLNTAPSRGLGKSRCRANADRRELSASRRSCSRAGFRSWCDKRWLHLPTAQCSRAARERSPCRYRSRRSAPTAVRQPERVTDST